MQGESSSKAGKQCFTWLDIAEPKLILYKDNYIFRFLKYIVYFCIVMTSLRIPACHWAEA